MRVRMLTSAPGSPDGVTVNEYDKDSVYEVTDALGKVLLSEGLAVLDNPKPAPAPEPEPESKKADGPEENK